GGPRARRCATPGAVARWLPSVAERARRSARQARPAGGGGEGVPARGVAHEERARAQIAARTGRGVRARRAAVAVSCSVRSTKVCLFLLRALRLLGLPERERRAARAREDAHPSERKKAAPPALLPRHRQIDHEGGTFPARAPNLDPPAVRIDDLLCDVQP